VPLQQLLGTSPAMVAVRDELSRLVARPAAAPKRLPSLLITGETGTGKGLVARLIHQIGPRSATAFVDLNCAAIPETLLEAELFGFERGAFTDARAAKAGLLQVAHRGTIFLDEIGLMPDTLQAKLLKALEDRSVRRLGGTRAEPADAWVLAATSEDLGAAIRARRFREDLDHRVAVVTVHLPALRERGDDVLMLARHYLDRACAEYGLANKALTADADAALRAYTWPGNVRELANVMERVALLTDASQVSAEALRLPRVARVPAPVRGVSVNEQIAIVERTRIEEALRAEEWNISRAAARLGLARNTLRYRMERHGLFDEQANPRRRSESAPGDVGDRGRLQTRPSSPVRWERVRITILHADIAAADPEAVDHERLQTLEQIAAKASAFGARMLELGTHWVKATFGLDVIEDAAQHAAHAAFALHRDLSTSRSSASRPRVRVALHTDDMLVGRMEDRVEIDADARRRADALIDEMLAAAPAEPIMASGSTRVFLERRFDVEPVGAVSGGERQPWRVLGLSDADRRAVIPFVSRVHEMAMLDDLLAQVEDGRGRALLIAGDPGIGKTRLLQEFRRRTRPRAAWLEGAGVSFGSALPFHPLIDLLKNAFAVQPADSDETIGERIDRTVASLNQDVRTSAPFLRSLLSIGASDPSIGQLDPKLRRAGTFEAIARLLHALAEVRPLIVVLEDVHWMDPATGEFLALMAENLVSGRILLCATCRTGYTLPLAPGTFGTQFTLSRVSRSDAGAIGSALLGVTTLSAELQQLLDDKTEGNPFFVEEVLRSLQERGLLERRGDEVALVRPLAKIDLPDTVRDVLLGRLGRLDPGARDLLRIAAVIGREFPRRVLERVIPAPPASLEERLRSLRSAELIQNARVWPEIIYTFKHALTHEVAYDAQQETERRSEHARIGEAVEQVYADRLSEQFGVLAHHYTQAERWDKALEYLLAAAQQAEHTFATREALAHYDAALRAAERPSGGGGDPETLIKIHLAKARLYFVTSEFAQSRAEGERVLPLARLTGNRTKEAEALVTIAWAATWSRDIEAALRFAGEALAVAEPAGLLSAHGRALLTIGFVRGVTGVLDESQVALDKAIALSTAARDSVNHSLSLTIGGLLHSWEGDYAQALRLQSEALSIAREHAQSLPLLFSCFMRGLTLTGKGDYDEAFAMFSEGLSLAERVGDQAIYHRLLNCLGWLYADLGDLDEAESLNMRSAQIGRRRTDPGTEPNAELNLGEIYASRGDLAHAQEQYDGVFKYWKDPSTTQWMKFRYSIRMFAGMGQLALARGDLDAARRHSAECLDLASRTGSRKNLVKGTRLAAEIALAARDADAAEAHFRTSRDLAAALGNPVQHWQSELALGRFLRETGRGDEGLLAFQRAWIVMQHVRDRLRDERLRAAFAKNPDLLVVQGLISET
jgi:transcriptional regulator with AAA-type ATPase domain/tetratricopeptide (TPR) repeat protein